jgi:hypothetical protein
MLATTVAGDANTFRELEAMYLEAGFKDIKANPIPISPHTIAIGCASRKLCAVPLGSL